MESDRIFSENLEKNPENLNKIVGKILQNIKETIGRHLIECQVNRKLGVLKLFRENLKNEIFF